MLLCQSNLRQWLRHLTTLYLTVQVSILTIPTVITGKQSFCYITLFIGNIAVFRTGTASVTIRTACCLLPSFSKRDSLTVAWLSCSHSALCTVGCWRLISAFYFVVLIFGYQLTVIVIITLKSSS